MEKKIKLLSLLLFVGNFAFAMPGNMPKAGWVIFSIAIFAFCVWGAIDLFLFGKGAGIIELGIALVLFLILSFIDDPSIPKEFFSSMFECYL